jgi:hypothetical protein
MAKSGGTIIRNIFVWSFERGTLQYDIICALILAFIFFVPKSCFTARHADAPLAGSVQAGQHAQPEHPSAGTSQSPKKP